MKVRRLHCCCPVPESRMRAKYFGEVADNLTEAGPHCCCPEPESRMGATYLGKVSRFSI